MDLSEKMCRVQQDERLRKRKERNVMVSKTDGVSLSTTLQGHSS